MCPWRCYPLYCLNIFWSSCDPINTSVWLPGDTGNFPSLLMLHLSCITKIVCHIRIPSTWQRVLEHCKDPTTQQKVMDEILGAVSMLAQDQYGNYVVQVYNFFWLDCLGFFLYSHCSGTVEACFYYSHVCLVYLSMIFWMCTLGSKPSIKLFFRNSFDNRAPTILDVHPQFSSYNVFWKVKKKKVLTKVL